MLRRRKKIKEMETEMQKKMQTEMKSESQTESEPAGQEPVEAVPPGQEPVRERSFMLGIPLREADITDPKQVIARLQAVEDIGLRTSFLEDGKIHIQADCLGDTWMMEVWATDFTVPDFYRTQHSFPDVVFEGLKMAEAALVTSMEFGEDPLASYHAQLKLLDAMLPDKLAVLDDSSEKILSPMWVSLAASSDIHPSPNYIFTVQAVGGGEDQDGQVWLHTHGLARCGIPDLEIIDSRTGTYNDHYHIIASAASRLLESDAVKPKQPMFLGRLSEDVDLVITLVPWEEAVTHYKEDLLGGKADRKESHNGNTCCIFLYPDEEHFKRGEYRPVSIYDDLLADNPLYMLSNRETARMKALAAERLSYVKRAWEEGLGNASGGAESGKGKADLVVLVKIGLQVDEKYRSEDNEKEHIWFQLTRLDEDGFEAQLTQEPYYIEGLHEGHIGRYTFDQITDWIIFAPEYRISPDDVYLMEAFPESYNDALN